jgi:type IV pilus assembly protein PilE
MSTFFHGRRGIVTKPVTGFTLIEVMITVAILAIIVAIAFPSYQEHVAKTRRGEAMAALLAGAQALERYYSANGRYVVADGSTLPTVYQAQVPATGTPYYNIAAVPGTPTNNTFTLRATRAGVMAGDDCGNFELNQAGVRTLHDKASGKPADQCWRQ